MSSKILQQIMWCRLVVISQTSGFENIMCGTLVVGLCIFIKTVRQQYPIVEVCIMWVAAQALK